MWQQQMTTGSDGIIATQRVTGCGMIQGQKVILEDM